MKKKLISVLLLLALLLVGCADTIETTSDESNASSESLAPWQNRVQQIDALYGETASRLGKTPVSLSKGCKVTSSREGRGSWVQMMSANLDSTRPNFISSIWLPPLVYNQ
jgi:hypothetical protein